VESVAGFSGIRNHYGADDRLIAETDGSGNPLRDYIYLGNEPVAVKIYGSQAGIYYFINDHLGTPQVLVDSTGATVWQAAYLPFGKAQVQIGTITNNLRFPGQYFDAETGLHYNWHRYYDPSTGRYLTPDPIGLEGGINLYSYTSNNPVNAVDPFGLEWIYSQSTGQISHQPSATLGGGPPQPIGTGYSGNGQGLNNPAMQGKPFVGPIPQGDYDIGQATSTKGPLTLPLNPQHGTNTFGRDAFRIHGDNSKGDQSASEGCVVTSRNVRNQIHNSPDRTLRVIP
jgi:RHS repeat-associated protein